MTRSASEEKPYKVVGASVPRELAEDIDLLRDEHGYENRSALIREALEAWVAFRQRIATHHNTEK